jgi:hypothetical protein
MDKPEETAMQTHRPNLEKGQSLVLIALLILALMAMLALTLDGGMAFFQRRNAQTAADAGALAGARELCTGATTTTAYNSALQYTCNLNGADLPPDTVINVNGTDKRVTVTSSITFQNFFAHLIGQPDTTVRAQATAGCFRPCYAESVLPVLWSCRPPIEGLSESEDCQQQRISWDTLQGYLAPPRTVHPELYVVMDSFTYDADLKCVEDYPPPVGTIICDFDSPPDGEADFLASGGRSWADLDGSNAAKDCGGTGEGAGELADWVDTSYPCDMPRHTWLPDEMGNMTSVYDAVYDKWLPNKGLLVVIPVFDDFCKDGYPVNPLLGGGKCASSASHPGPFWHTGLDTINEGATNQNHFHIIDFAAFYVTCVRKSNNFPPESCPGYERFKTINAATPGVTPGNLQSMKSIEGYFIDGVPPGLFGKCEGGVDTGAWTLYLD